MHKSRARPLARAVVERGPGWVQRMSIRIAPLGTSLLWPALTSIPSVMRMPGAAGRANGLKTVPRGPAPDPSRALIPVCLIGRST
jgi:hypothetical protein